MLQKSAFLDYKININKDKEFKILKNYLKGLFNKFEIFKIKPNTTIDDLEGLKDRTIDILLMFGDVSDPFFEIRDELKDKYTWRYISSPAIGRKIFLEHFANIHHKFDFQKNKCYDLIDEIDEFKFNLLKNKLFN